MFLKCTVTTALPGGVCVTNSLHAASGVDQVLKVCVCVFHLEEMEFLQKYGSMEETICSTDCTN